MTAMVAKKTRISHLSVALFCLRGLRLVNDALTQPPQLKHIPQFLV